MESQQQSSSESNFTAFLERRTEVRLEGDCVAGIESYLCDAAPLDGWDQQANWSGLVSNLSPGGIEVQMKHEFPYQVDQPLFVGLRFPGEKELLQIPAMIRHRHKAENHLLVGLQFLWKPRDSKDPDLEYRVCKQLFRCELRKRRSIS